jgi:large repetitive protein
LQNTGTVSSPAYAAVVDNPFGLGDVLTDAKSDFADLDGDGDLDILSGTYYGELYYFENTGTSTSPAFSGSTVFPFGLSDVGAYVRPHFVDLDNDLDLDLMVGEISDGFYYFENTGTVSAPAFAAPILNPFGLYDMGSWAFPFFVDLDWDGDYDLFSGEQYGNIVYFQNTGTATSPVFATGVNNPFNFTDVGNLSTAGFADLDNDGDKDFLSGNVLGDFNYFENISPLGVGDNFSNTSTVTIFPNPSKGSITISSQANANYVLQNSLGQTVQAIELNENNKFAVFLNSLEQGMYFLVDIKNTSAKKVMIVR